jgi:predicted secreted protein
MTFYFGRDFQLRVISGGAPILVGGLTTTDFAVNTTVLEASSPQQGAWQQRVSGLRNVRIAAEGVFEDSAAEALVRAAALGGVVIECSLIFAGGDTLQGFFVVSRYERAGTVAEMESYRLTLESAGTLVYTGA